MAGETPVIMPRYQRIFGVGPLGAIVSLLLLWVAWLGAGQMPEYAFDIPTAARWAILTAGLLAGISVIVWSVRSLPVASRGRVLCRGGVFAWVRHPLYAAFLSLINPALAIFLDHPAYLIWAAVLHPLWHAMIGYEEGSMRRRFGVEYLEYAAATGRFFPRKLFINH